MKTYSINQKSNGRSEFSFEGTMEECVDVMTADGKAEIIEVDAEMVADEMSMWSETGLFVTPNCEAWDYERVCDLDKIEEVNKLGRTGAEEALLHIVQHDCQGTLDIIS